MNESCSIPGFIRGPAHEAAARVLALGFLGKAFAEPPAGELLMALTRESLLEDWPLPDDNGGTAAGLGLLRGFFRNWRPAQVPDMQAEYQRLFLGPDILAPPWESVWRSEEHLIFEAQTLAVREFYARFGLIFPRRRQEPDDHFGLELLFLAHLDSLALQARDDKAPAVVGRLIAAGREFLNHHLLCWGYDFLACVANRAQSDYFQGLARLGEGTLQTVACHYGAAGPVAQAHNAPPQN
ncbi:MAG: molecular chaperone TorD family protein [Acidobacteria bacterium]|nr:molecular chaperone TorD family protein [Acidobacteriota bacterium]